jgi:hypothetical protein
MKGRDRETRIAFAFVCLCLFDFSNIIIPESSSLAFPFSSVTTETTDFSSETNEGERKRTGNELTG